MTDQTPVPNQSNSQDNQNFKINIEQIYKDFIKTIDNARSVVNIADPNNQKLLNSFTIDSFTGAATTGSLKPEITPQESRCHAFYRIIGFPVVSSDFLIYNPGHDIIFNSTRTIDVAKKVQIANKPLEGFQKLSIDRENYINNLLKIFSNNLSIDASVLALSGINIRGFDAPIKKSPAAIEKPFNSDNQSYVIDSSSLIGYNGVLFTEYKDNDGNTPTKYTSKRSHIIKPFMVDARIDLSTPALQKIAVPFVPDDSYLKISETDSLQRPLIEKIIRDRFAVVNEILDSGETAQKTIDFIKSTTGLKDEDIVNVVSSGNVFGLTDKNQFVKHLNMARAMMVELHKAQDIITNIQSQYYWAPIPNENGPELGSSVQPIFGTLTDNLTTPQDQSIIYFQIKTIMDQINSQAASLSGTPDVGGFALSKFTDTFEPSTSSAMGDSNSIQLQELVDQRNNSLTNANNALRTIEIIMGEFSGLGLCDIIAIIGALYIMPKESLLGFLDDDVLVRAKSALNIDTDSPGINTALNDLTSKVSDFYNLMNKLYKDVHNNNTQ